MHITEEKLKSLLEKSDLVDEKAFEEAKEESIRSGQFIPMFLSVKGLFLKIT